MDPLSIISGCAGLITAIGSLSVSINTFVRSCREARSDLDLVSRELHSLQTVLELIEEDAKDDTKPFPPTIQHHVSGIVTNCGSVVLEVETCIKKYGDGRIKSRAAWAINGQGDMEKLRSSLEAHKSALELALDMLSLSLTKDIKADTTEIREDTAAIKDDTTLILLQIEQLQARLPDTAAAPNDYILQKFLEDMATYTETTLDVDPSYSDETSSIALSIVDEDQERSHNSPQYDLPILEPQDPAAFVVSHSPDSSNPEDALKHGNTYTTYPEPQRYAQWPRPARVDITNRPKRPVPAASEFALLDAFDPRWRELYGDYLHENEALSNDTIRENQEFVIGILKKVQMKLPNNLHYDYPPVPSNYIRAESDLGQPLPSIPDPQHTDPLSSISHRSPQQLIPNIVPIRGPIKREEDDTATSPHKKKGLSSQEEHRIQRFRGNVVVDIPAPDWILTRIPESLTLERNEFTHSRFSFITCLPEEFGDQNYTLRATLFAQPRQTQFILVVQIRPNDEDFIRRWDLIHNSIIFTQKKLDAIGGAHEFWKQVVVHLHLAHGTEWAHRSFDNPLVVLEAIAGNLTLSGKLTQIGSEHHEPIDKNSSEIGGHPVRATMSEYTVQLRQLNYSPGATVTAEVPIQVVITTARVPKSSSNIHWSKKYSPWTFAVNEVLQAEHIIDMSEISDAFLSRTDFLWDVLRRDRSFPLYKYKPFRAWDLEIFQFDSLVAEIHERMRLEPVSKKRRSRVSMWLKSRVTSSDEERR